MTLFMVLFPMCVVRIINVIVHDMISNVCCKDNQ